MTQETITPTATAEAKLRAAEAKVETARQALEEAKAEEAVAAKRGEFSLYMCGAVKDGIASTGMTLPQSGFWLEVKPDDKGNPLVNLHTKAPGRAGGTRAPRGSKSGNGRKSIGDLGNVTGFRLADGAEHKSAASAMAGLGIDTKGDSAGRLILGWARAHPDEAEEVTVITDGGDISLKEACEALGVEFEPEPAQA